MRACSGHAPMRKPGKEERGREGKQKTKISCYLLVGIISLERWANGIAFLKDDKMLSSSRVINYSRNWQNMHITIRCPPTQYSIKATKDKLIATKHKHLRQLPKLSRIFDLQHKFLRSSNESRKTQVAVISFGSLYMMDLHAYHACKESEALRRSIDFLVAFFH